MKNLVDNIAVLWCLLVLLAFAACILYVVYVIAHNAPGLFLVFFVMGLTGWALGRLEHL